MEPTTSWQFVNGHLGMYALDLGDSIMIHGTEEYAQHRSERMSLFSKVKTERHSDLD